VNNILQNAQKEVVLHVLQKFKYFYIHSLVEYFQVHIVLAQLLSAWLGNPIQGVELWVVWSWAPALDPRLLKNT